MIESRRIDVQPLLTEMPLSGAESTSRPAADRSHAIIVQIDFSAQLTGRYRSVCQRSDGGFREIAHGSRDIDLEKVFVRPRGLQSRKLTVE